MKNFWCNVLAIVLLLCANAVSLSLSAQQTLMQVNGWNAYVHLPAGYNSTTATYPTIIFFPGIGEVGNNPASLIAYGPGAYIAQGWNGNVNVDGNTVEFIVISLQPNSAFPNEASMNTRLQTLKNLYRMDPNRLYLTGLSHGGWCSSTFVTGDPMGGPYNYASQIAAVVTVEGMIPDDNQPYPNLFDNFSLSGGKYLGFEQINDGRDTRTVVDRMNATIPNSGIYVQTTFGNGGHCCWSEFYGGGGTQPGIFNLSGTAQNLYQWLARQSRTNSSNIPPVSNAGADATITLPTNTITLQGSGTDADGTVTSFLWNQIAGPSAATITPNNTPVTVCTNLIQGIYKFTLKVTDNTTASTVDTVVVTVNPDPATTTCNAAAPVTWYLNNTQPGEIYRPNGSLWKGGDTVKITGTSYSVIEFYNVGGDPCRPLVIMPQTTLATPAFRLKGNCRYIKLWGGTTPYGIKINGGALAITSCHHIEANNIECTGGSNGIYCKQDVDYSDTMTWHPNYRMTKFAFRNIWVHDVNGEGMYIGITQPDGLTVHSTYSGQDTVIVPIRLDSVEVSNCLVERTTWDGIQLSNARNGNKIFNNTVKDYGTLNISSQQAGIILGGNCNGDIYGNTVKKGTGNGIQVFGFGVINVYNNTLDSCGYNGGTNSNGTEGQQTIYASDYLITTDNNPKQTINAYGNAVNHPKNSGGIFITDYFNNSFPSSVYNNTFCIPNAPGNWESIYIKAYVPGSAVSNNTLSCVSVPNVPPVANAGTDITITLPVSTASLNGSGTDMDGTIVSYNWVKAAGPGAGAITNASSASTGLTGLVQGVYSFVLTVTDNAGAIGRDTVLVTVNAAPNVVPVANAGNDITITLPVNTTTLNGLGTDSDGTIVAYAWTKIAGPTAGTISSPGSAATSLTALVQGIYRFQLTVTDNSGATARDTVQVTVNPAPNVAPTANAGADISITLPVNTTTLNGSGIDTDGTIVSYAWTKITGPTAGAITSPSSASTALTALVQGIYKFQLTVTDNSGAIARDTVQVTVNPALNVAPTANAGADISITLPVNTATLNGSGIDTDGTIVSYAWTKITGPTAGAITSPSSASTALTALVQGVYKFQLTVTDNSGAIARDTVQVTVNPALNVAPTANAGADISITLPVNTATLNGSGIDTDGTIVSYAWTKITGPTAGAITSPSSASTALAALVQGVYTFQLTVTDNSGAIARDTVQVTVNPAANIVPVAHAGADVVITLPINSTTLNGSGTDTDGAVVSYGWTKIAGPTAGTISSPSSASTALTALVQGVYKFQLTVTDNNGAIGRDTVQVTVNPAANIAPTANAGADISITLPVNTTTLNGSGADPDGTIVSYAWIKISGPAPSSIVNANAATASLVNLVQGIYKYQLTVTDNNGAIGRDSMEVIVYPANNIAPVAHAGTDIVITLPVNSTALNGSGTDADGTIVSYTWTKISGPAAGILSNANTSNPIAGNLVQGVYNYQLMVTDNAGAIGRDTVSVVVNPAANVLPVANAGNNIVITLPVNIALLNGSGIDPDGSIVAYTWIKISGPTEGLILSPASSTTAVSGLTQGIYIYQLMVTDNSGATATSNVQVTVNPAVAPPPPPMPANVSPVVFAGDDINIYLPDQQVALSGTASDPDGSIASYEWRVISGPAQYIFGNNLNAQTALSNLSQGVYTIALKVTDNQGATAADTMLVTVGNVRLPAPDDKVIVYPNPVVSTLHINISSAKPLPNLKMILYAANGKKVYEKQVAITSNAIEQINMSGMAAGMYVLQVVYGKGNVITEKIIKQ